MGKDLEKPFSLMPEIIGQGSARVEAGKGGSPMLPSLSKLSTEIADTPDRFLPLNANHSHPINVGVHATKFGTLRT